MADITDKPHIMMHSSDVESAHGSFKGFHRYDLITLSVNQNSSEITRYWSPTSFLTLCRTFPLISFITALSALSIGSEVCS